MRWPVWVLAAVFAVGPAGAGPPAPQAYVDPMLRAELSAGAPQVAILVLEPDRESSVLSALHAWGLAVHPYEALHQAALVLPADRLDAVAGLPGVVTVYRNERMRPLLDRAAPYVGATVVWNTFQDRGAGVTVMVVDTGVDGTHPDVRFGGNLVQNVAPTRLPNGLVAGYAEGVASTDSDGHGTHVAGIVAGTGTGTPTGSPNKYRGIANGASLVGFAAGLTNPGSKEPSFESVTVLEAFDYALEKRGTYGTRVVTNSWGTTGAFDPRSPINVATFALYRAGLVVTFAAGNEGDNGAGSLNPYSVAPWVLSVGAGDYLNRRASFSSIGTDPAVSHKPYDHPDLLAPGVGITAAEAAADGSALVSGAAGLLGGAVPRSDRYTSKSGTSMATPMVAGTAALVLAANPRLSPDDVYDVLAASATPLPRLPPWEAGAGYLDALEAYRLARTVPGHLDRFLQGQVKYGGPAGGDADYSDDALTVGLGNGTAKSIGGTDTTIPGFFHHLVTTGDGLAVATGALVLTLLSFRIRRRP